MYHYTGESDFWLGRSSQVTGPFEEQSGVLWDKLNEIKPCLWREGETYPNDVVELREHAPDGTRCPTSRATVSVPAGIAIHDVALQLA